MASEKRQEDNVFATSMIGSATSNRIDRLSSSTSTSASVDGDQCSSPSWKTLRVVDNSSKCTARLAQLCNNSKFSDVTLIISGKRYAAHRLLLAHASDVFERMLMNGNWTDSHRAEIELQEHSDCVSAFGDFLRYIYSGEIVISMDTVLGLLVLADKYNIQDLCEACSSFMVENLVSAPYENKAIIWYQYATACGIQQLQDNSLHYILYNMDTVIHSPDWVLLTKANLMHIIKESDLVISNEYALLDAVVRWLQENEHRREAGAWLDEILQHIRFPMIFPEQLAEFEESQFSRHYHAHLSPHLLSAYKYHALSSRGTQHVLPDNIAEHQFHYRNYTDDAYSIHVDILRKGYRTCPQVSSKVEKALSLPTTICNTSQELHCKMKVTFYPHGYYTTALWNGQVNLAKATEQTKLVIVHRGGSTVSEGDVSVVIYGHNKGIKYVMAVMTHRVMFDMYGSYEIENVLDIEKMKAEDSPFIVDGSIHIKIFVRALSFRHLI